MQHKTTHRRKRKCFLLILLLSIVGLTKAQCPLNQAVDFTATDCHGTEVHLFDILDGGQAVLINFFITTDSPCKQAMPKIVESYYAMGCNMHDVFYMEISGSDSDAACQTWCQNYGVEYPTIGTTGGGAAIISQYGIGGFPTVILIMPNREIVIQDLWPISNAQAIITALEQFGIQNPVIGYGGTATNQYLPSFSYSNYSLIQQIYTADEIGKNGQITSVAFYNGGATKTRNYDIYLVNTNKNSFESTNDWIVPTADDLVFSGNVTMEVDTWTTIVFNTPFVYNGDTNLALVVDDNSGNSTDSPYMACRVFETEEIQAIQICQDTPNCDPYNPYSYTGTLYSQKNQIILSFKPSSTEPVVIPDTLNLSYRPNDAWMRPYSFQIYNPGEYSVINSITTDNGYFQLEEVEVPIFLGSQESREISITTGNGDGEMSGHLIINYGNNQEVQYDLSAIAYDPAVKDVWETAYEVTVFPFTDSLVVADIPLYDNYNLPPTETQDGADAVYKLVFDQDVNLNASMTSGDNGKLVLYREGFKGEGGPKEDNSYIGPMGDDYAILFETLFGEGTSTSTYLPFYTYYDNSIAENLFLADELVAAGMKKSVLHSLSWYATNSTGYLQKNISIWLANVTETALNTGTSHLTSEMTLVYTGSCTPQIGWNEFEFNESDFVWDGESNLLICVQRNNGTYNSSIKWQTHNPEFYASAYTYRDGTYYNMLTTTYSMYKTDSYRPNIIFKGKTNEVGSSITDRTLSAGTYYLVTSSTSEAWGIDINIGELTCPDIVANPRPTDYNTNVNPTAVQLQWTLGERTTEYELLMGTDSDHLDTIVDWTRDLAETYMVTGLLNNTNYLWQVLERNDGCPEGTEGPVWSFTTLLSGPQNFHVDNNQLFEGDDVQMAWTPLADTNILSYNIYQDNVLIGNTTTNNFMVSGLTYNMDGYNFHVTAVYAGGESNASNTAIVYVSGTGTVSGHVYEVDGVTGIKNATLTFTGNDEYGASRTIVFTTDANGFYTGTLMTGNYSATASREGYQAKYYDGNIHIAFNETTGAINIILDELFTPVSGVVAEYYPDADNLDSPFVKVNWDYSYNQGDDPSNLVYDFEDNSMQGWTTIDGGVPQGYGWQLASLTSGNIIEYMMTICDSELPYVWQGVTFTEAGVKQIVYESAQGGDSIVVLHLFVYPTEYIEEYMTITESELPYTWHGTSYTQSGNYDFYDMTDYGCERIVTLHLTVIADPESNYEDITVNSNNASPINSFPNSGVTVTNSPTNVAMNPTRDGIGHDGSSDCVCSKSYAADNFLVSPLIALGGSISFYARVMDNAFAAEHFGVAVSTTSNTDPNAFTMLEEWTIDNRSQGSWYQYTVDLSAYSGTGYVAIRHFDCNNMSYLFVDDISIYEPNKNIPTRSFSHFKVYRTDAYNDGPYTEDNTVLLADNVADNLLIDETWQEAEAGVYKFGVSCVYEGNRESAIAWGDLQQNNRTHEVIITNQPSAFANATIANPIQSDRESAITWSNAIDKNMDFNAGEVNITVTLNSGDSPEGILVSFINLNPEEQVLYPVEDVVLDASGYYAWDSFRRGDYQVQVSFNDYYTITEEVSIWDATALNYVLEEVNYGLSNLYVSRTGWAMWNDDQHGNSVPSIDVIPETETADAFFVDFESGIPEGWTIIDADGDGNNWMLGSVALSTGYGHNASLDMILSKSYDNNSGALYPDNYLVSPQVQLGGSITFYACAQDAAWASEHFGVAVSTTSNTNAAAFTTLQEWTLSAKSVSALTEYTRSGNRDQGAWYQFTVDLSAYAGQTGYIAIRHFNCSDMFYLDVDDIELIPSTKNNRHFNNYQVELSDNDENVVYEGSVSNCFMQLPVDNLVDGEIYHLKVAAVYSSGLSVWSETDWAYQACENFESITELNMEMNDTVNVISWTYPTMDNKSVTINSNAFVCNNGGGTYPYGWLTFGVNNVADNEQINSSRRLYGGDYCELDGYVYSTYSSNWYKIDPLTGVIIEQGSLGRTFYDCAWDRSTSTMYAISGSYLYKWNLTNHTVTSIGSLGRTFRVLACDMDGQLYGISYNSPGYLYRVDKTNASVQSVGSTGIACNSNYQSGGFDPNTGKMYWYGAGTGTFAEVNVTTGVATIIDANTSTNNGTFFIMSNSQFSSTTGILGAMIYRDGELIGFSTQTSYTDTIATGNHEYEVRVVYDGMRRCPNLNSYYAMSCPLSIGGTIYEVTVTAVPAQGGITTGSGSYINGFPCTVTATANEDYAFTNWTKNGEEITNVPEYSFRVRDNVNIEANFIGFTPYWEVVDNPEYNMQSLIGVVNVNGVEVTGNYIEVAALCGDECRGRQMLTYYPEQDRFMVCMTIYGQDGDNITFSFYDHELGEETEFYCLSELTFNSAAVVGTYEDPYAIRFGILQATAMQTGWNWYSTIVEQDGNEGLEMLEASLGSNGVMIKSQTDGFDINYGNLWMGNLEYITNDQMYMINTNAPIDALISGISTNVSNHPITLYPGWTWVGYPYAESMDINDALSNLNATNGDVLKTKHTFSTYIEGQGWFGTLNTLEPGAGMMYNSKNSINTTYIYSETSERNELTPNLTAENNYWTPDVYAYPDNMSVMAVVELNHIELADSDYELAAFYNGQCIGSTKLVYVDPANRYMAFLTLTSEENKVLTFGLYHTATDLEYQSTTETVAFVPNAVVGSMEEPFIVHFDGMTDLVENLISAKIYPNPVDRGSLFNIVLSNRISETITVEIVNALGETVSIMRSSQVPILVKAPDVEGVYMVRIVVDDKTSYSQKLIVK